MDLSCLGHRLSGELYREGDSGLVTKVHERAKGKPLRYRELYWVSGDAFWKRPLHMRWLAGVAGVDPVDVPSLFEGEDQTNGKIASLCDLWPCGDEFDGK